MAASDSAPHSPHRPHPSTPRHDQFELPHDQTFTAVMSSSEEEVSEMESPMEGIEEESEEDEELNDSDSDSGIESDSELDSDDEEEEEEDEDEEGSYEDDEDISSEEVGSEASSGDGSDDEEEDEDDEDESDDDEEDESEGEEGDAEDEDGDESVAPRRRRRRHKKSLTPHQRAERLTMRRTLKSVKKVVFKSETPLDPPFFRYLSAMHEWHDLTVAEQRKKVTEERHEEVTLAVYDPDDGVADGRRSVWDAIQAEVDSLHFTRRLSSPLKFRRIAEICMDMEHTGRLRRMIIMESSILHVVLYMLRVINGKERPPEPEPIHVLLPARSLAAGNGSQLEPLAEEGEMGGMEESKSNIASSSKRFSGRRTRSSSRNGIGRRTRSSSAELKEASPARVEIEADSVARQLDALPTRTRSAARRATATLNKAERPTTFTNIPSIQYRSSSVLLPHVIHRPASAPPQDLTSTPISRNNNRGCKRRRAPDSASSSATVQTQELPSSSATPPRPTDRMYRQRTLVLPTTDKGGLQRFSSHPQSNESSPIKQTTLSLPGSLMLETTSSCPVSPHPSPTGTARNNNIGDTNISSPHRAWIASLIKHRDDLHLFLTALLFMSFVHTTDSEKLATFKRQMLTGLLHEAEWGKQAIQKQMQRMLRVPTVSSSHTSNAAVFASVASPPTPSSALAQASKRHRLAHTLNPNAGMIYQFDAMCLELISRDLLPSLSRPLPGQEVQEAGTEMDVSEETAKEDEALDGVTTEGVEGLELTGEEEVGASPSMSDDSDVRRRQPPPVKHPPRRRRSLAGGRGRSRSMARTAANAKKEKAGKGKGKKSPKEVHDDVQAHMPLRSRLRSSSSASSSSADGLSPSMPRMSDQAPSAPIPSTKRATSTATAPTAARPSTSQQAVPATLPTASSTSPPQHQPLMTSASQPIETSINIGGESKSPPWQQLATWVSDTSKSVFQSFWHTQHDEEKRSSKRHKASGGMSHTQSQTSIDASARENERLRQQYQRKATYNASPFMMDSPAIQQTTPRNNSSSMDTTTPASASSNGSSSGGGMGGCPFDLSPAPSTLSMPPPSSSTHGSSNKTSTTSRKTRAPTTRRTTRRRA